MKYFAVADPHGFYNALRRALEDAGFFKNDEDGKLIVCDTVSNIKKTAETDSFEQAFIKFVKEA